MAQPVAYLVRVMIERISFGLPLDPQGDHPRHEGQALRDLLRAVSVVAFDATPPPERQCVSQRGCVCGPARMGTTA
jgi:hypothetical protein